MKCISASGKLGSDQGTIGNEDRVDMTLLHHPLYYMNEVDLGAFLYSVHHYRGH